MAWRELANNEQGTKHKVCYEWFRPFEGLPTGKTTASELEETEWSQDRTDLMLSLGYSVVDVIRTRARMVMGAMRYGRLSQGNYRQLPKSYYDDRLRAEQARASKNREGAYDGINIAYLSYLAGYITHADYFAYCVLFTLASKYYMAEDRKELV